MPGWNKAIASKTWIPTYAFADDCVVCQQRMYTKWGRDRISQTSDLAQAARLLCHCLRTSCQLQYCSITSQRCQLQYFTMVVASHCSILQTWSVRRWFCEDTISPSPPHEKLTPLPSDLKASKHSFTGARHKPHCLQVYIHNQHFEIKFWQFTHFPYQIFSGLYYKYLVKDANKFQ